MAQQKYEIINRIGTGGMAEVFKASSTSLKGFQKLVAIKRVLPSLTQNDRFVRMFMDEAKIALPLNHTNIVQTFDLGLADETYFIVMEYVDGTDLKAIIQKLAEQRQRMSAGEVAYIGLEICKGLQYAHSRTDKDGESLNIIHRDISPPNILLSRAGEVKITDFGLAKAKSQAELTDPGVVKGKFGYLSPEAAEGEEIDARTDIFACGILMWEMLACERLFLGESDFETLKMVKRTKIPSLSSKGCEVPGEFESIIRRALAKDPEERFQTARELAEALAGFLAGANLAVSSFTLADRVRSIIGEEARAAESQDLAPADRAVQREINQFVSIEDIRDLDLRLADRQAIEGGDSPVGEGDWEDPRGWSDLGFEEDNGDGLAERSLPEEFKDKGDSWQEGQLEDVARATQSMPAVVGPDERGRRAQSGGAPEGEGADQAPPPEQEARERGDEKEQKDQKDVKKGSGSAEDGAETAGDEEAGNPTAIVVLAVLVVLGLVAVGAVFLAG